MVEKQGADNVDEKFQEQIIHNYINLMTEKITNGYVGAVSTSDEKTDGYYLVKWCGNLYTLQESLVNTSFLGNNTIESGAMVCDAVYLNPLPYENLKKNWYEVTTHKALIPLQQVLRTGIKMNSLSDDNKTSSSGKKFLRFMKQRTAVKIDESEVEEISEEMARRFDVDIEA